MYVSHLTLHDFRSYSGVEVPLEAGVSAFLGRNGQGKTNLVEAIDYLSRLSSHRVATDTPLVRAGAERAVVRAAVVKDERTAVLEVEINPGKANRGRINRSPLSRVRELVGLVRTVVFSPDDLTLSKGDPGERRRFLDDLLIMRTPRLAGVRSDYDRVLRQRNSLLKSARAGDRDAVQATLGVWDAHLARVGGELLAERLGLVEALRPYVGRAYQTVAKGAGRDDARIDYRSTVGDLDTLAALAARSPESQVVEPAEPLGEDVSPRSGRGAPATDAGPPDHATLTEALLAEIERRRGDELDRGVSLVGPHRDDLLLELGDLPVKGYASHGEAWSFALALRLAAFDLLRDEGDDPILILDDVFAELDTGRREQLAELVRDAEQVLVTAAVPDDVPDVLDGARFTVGDGAVNRD